MDDILRKAIGYLLNQIEAGEVVSGLLLIEVDWGDQTPPATDESQDIQFQGSVWPMVFTNSELVLRRALCRVQNGRVIFVFRGGNGLKIPLDIRARAHKNTLYHVGLRHRLQARTERGWPPEVDYAEWRPSLERRLDELVKLAIGGGLRWDITRGDLEQMLVKVAFGIEVKGHAAPQLLADLLSAQRRSPTAPTDLDKSLLQGQLRLHQVDGSDVLMWAAEEPGRAEELVRTGVMLGAEQASRRVPNWGNLTPLLALLVNKRQLSEKDATAAVIELATRSLTCLPPQTRQSIVRAAQTALEDVLPKDSYNPWFPLAFERESERLAGCLSRYEPDAPAQVARLHEHLFASQHQQRLDALDQMAMLVIQRQMQSVRTESLSTVSAWATWYAEQGSRLDLAALKLMQHLEKGTGLDSFVQLFADDYWEWRSQLNLAFARQFLNNYEAALHDRDAAVFGTHRVMQWVIRPLLQDQRHVLLLVIDGMAYADLWHLLDQWAAQPRPVYVQRSQPVLSLLPSITSVSRKALFLNALPTDRLDDEQTYEEKARVTEEQSLQRAFPDHTVKLYNKTNLDSAQLVNDIHFSRTDMVAVILNEIDDDLRSSTTAVRLSSLEHLGLLVNAAQQALNAGWVVVVTADHGHTWHRAKSLRCGDIYPGGGERFAPLDPGELAPRGALVTNDTNIVRVQSGRQVAFLTASGAYFGRNPHRGYHGGAALEEVVVPCATLTFQVPSASAKDQVVPAGTDKPTETSYDLTGVVLTLRGGRVISLELPFVLSTTETRLLQTLARLGEATEKELKQAMATRRVAGPLSALRERLAAAGRAYDYIEDKGTGTDGAIYRFREEMLK